MSISRQEAVALPTPCIQVVVALPLWQAFDYRVTPQEHARLRIGMRVRVNFGRRQVTALVTALHASSDGHPRDLRAIDAILDDEAVLTPALLELAQFAADYYRHPAGEVLFQALPVLLRQGESAQIAPELRWYETALGRLGQPDLLRTAPRQRLAWQSLREESAGLSAQMAQVLGITTRDLRALEKRGYAEQRAIAPPPPVLCGLAESALPANAEQAHARDSVLADTGFQVSLLAGVTGSGKTEVYLQIIERLLERGQQALVLVPEISLTPQTLQRFRQRFLCPVLGLHSGLSDRERLHAWQQARAGHVGIVVGTRSALFTPLPRLGIIIVDEEHDPSFKQGDGFRYHARDLAVVRARIEKIPIVLGSATPALESLHNAQRGRYRLLRLQHRSNRHPPPALRLLDLRHQPLCEGMAESVLLRLQEHLDAAHQVLVFLNRRGYAPVLLCHDCGWRLPCPRCSTTPVWHRRLGRVICHHCGISQPLPQRCAACGSQDLRPLGIGTEKLQEMLAQRFPHHPLWRIDRDSIRSPRELEHTLQSIHRHEPGILLGTQMLAKGHHFAAVTLVVIVDIDAALFASDFRALERCAQLVIQVAGRAGRGDHPGEVLLQTHCSDHPLLQTLVDAGYESFAAALLDERAAMGLPPFGHQALLIAQGRDGEQAQSYLAELAQRLPAEIAPFGAMPAPIERKAGDFRAHLLLQSPSRQALHTALASLQQRLNEARPAHLRCWIDVDPQDLS